MVPKPCKYGISTISTSTGDCRWSPDSVHLPITWGFQWSKSTHVSLKKSSRQVAQAARQLLYQSFQISAASTIFVVPGAEKITDLDLGDVPESWWTRTIPEIFVGIFVGIPCGNIHGPRILIYVSWANMDQLCQGDFGWNPPWKPSCGSPLSRAKQVGMEKTDRFFSIPTISSVCCNKWLFFN